MSVFALPAHTSDRTQSVNISIFDTLKKYANQAVFEREIVRNAKYGK